MAFRLSPRRDSRLPRLQLVDSHILRPPSRWNRGRTFVYLQDLDKEVMREQDTYYSQLKVPAQEDDVVCKQLGLVELRPGDAIFARPKGDNSSELNISDVACSEAHRQQVIADIERVRGQLLGPEDEMSGDKPVKKNGQLVGGTAFERADAGLGIHEARAYSIGCSLENPTQLIAPPAAAKMRGVDVDNPTLAGEMRQELMEVLCRMAIDGVDGLPSEFAERMKMQVDLINVPTIGPPDNFYWNNLQLNLANAVAKDNAASLKSQLGFFGSDHLDRHDDPGGLTCAIWFSQLPLGYDPGRFHLLELGVFVKLQNIGSLYFCGLRRHGGTPSRAPKGEQPKAWAIRCLGILYPSNAMLENCMIYAVGSMLRSDANATKLLWTCGPELRQRQGANVPLVHSSHATWTSDGWVVSARKSLIRFVARSLYSFCVNILSQLPESWEVNINADKFMEAISFKSESEQSYETVEEWSMAPQMQDHTIEQKRRQAAEQWLAYRKKVSAFIHYATFHSPPSLSITVKDTSEPYTIGSHIQPFEGKTSKLGKRKRTIQKNTSGLKKAISLRSTSQESSDVLDAMDLNAEDNYSLRVEKEKPHERDIHNSDIEMENEDEFQETSDQVRLLDIEMENEDESQEISSQGKLFCIEIENVNKSQILDLGATRASFNRATLQGQGLKGHKAVVEIAKGWEDMRLASKEIGHIDLYRRHLRARYLLVYALAWNWLDRVSSYYSQSQHYQGHGTSDPLSHLAMDLSIALTGVRTGSYFLIASKYFSGLSSNPTMIPLPQRKQYLTNSEVQMRLQATLSHVLGTWLGFPLMQDGHARASFITKLIDLSGEEILWLDDTWTLFNSLRNFLLPLRSRRQVEISDLQPLFAHLEQLPIWQPDTPEFECASSIRDTIRHWRVFSSHDIESQPFLPVNSSSPSMPIGVLSPPNPPPHRPSLSPATHIRLSVVLEWLRISAGIFIGAPTDKVKYAGSRLEKMDQASPWNSVLQRMASNLDKYLPFREAAPSRRRVLCENGPFSPPLRATCAGLFSAVVFRSITYSADFLFDKTPYFDGLSAWNKSVKASNQPDDYFCNVSAYGARTQRHRRFAKAIWDVAKDSEQMLQEAETKPIKMLQFYDYARSSFPQVGNLTGYLLSADYAYAGLVEMPSTTDMGYIIHRIDAGAMKGLRVLGLLPTNRSKPPVDEVTEAFQRAYEFFDSNLTAEEKVRMGFNRIVTENLLCKVSRLNERLPWYLPT
ncbi:hypothetical protein EW146_g7993 [Bondarzewia mesenterica]|uniref:Uncharacterized protein n=1 Tax=Bondarzewia mesenterica TaxID=1095465 RepID=A0A4S4LI17_9AGAM|nr:hypothetical protein EW146_g7993 [Bondarzewia mesenterica]